MISFIIHVFFGILIYVLYQKFARRNLPPGPIPWPIIGNVIELARADGLPYEVLHAMSKKYGNVFSLVVGVVPTVNGHDQVRALFKNEDFDNRIQDNWILDRSYGKPQGIVFNVSNSWKETRQLTVKIMNDFGYAKKVTIEALMLEEIKTFIQKLKEKVEDDDVVLINNSFTGPMTNVLWSFITGDRLNLDDPEYTELLVALDGFSQTQQLGGTQLLSAFPFLAKVAPEMSGFAEIHRCNAKLQDYFEKVLKKYRDKGTYKTNPSSLIDAFLVEIDNNQDSYNPIYTDQNLVCVINDLFSAGSEPPGNSVGFAIRLMVQYPEIQTKVRAEIDQAMAGKNEMVNFDVKPLLRYTEATILEFLRVALPLPCAPRIALKTCNLGPYEIRQGTNVIVNIFSAHQDESVWGDPQNFRPERFLNENGDIVNSEKLLSFGIGKRNCLGEVAARTSVFIAFSNLIRHFEFEADPKTGIPNSENLFGLAHAPKPYRVRVKIRQNVF